MLVLTCNKDNIIHFRFIDEYINSPVFIGILDEIIPLIKSSQNYLEGNNRDNNLLYIDNASSHTSIDTKDHSRENNYRIITPPAYHSEFNLTELVFRHIKNHTYKKTNLDM
jgi:transposase